MVLQLKPELLAELREEAEDREAMSRDPSLALLLRAYDQLVDQNARLLALTRAYDQLVDQNAHLLALINSPELHNFADGVRIEMAHQRERWGSEHDAGKTPTDWLFLIGYLAGKATHAAIGGDQAKALHHCVSTAAAAGNWHAAILGADTTMRPGIMPPAGA